MHRNTTRSTKMKRFSPYYFIKFPKFTYLRKTLSSTNVGNGLMGNYSSKKSSSYSIKSPDNTHREAISTRFGSFFLNYRFSNRRKLKTIIIIHDVSVTAQKGLRTGKQLKTCPEFQVNQPWSTRLQLLHNRGFSVNKSFCQNCQNCIRAKNITAKKLPLSGLEPSTPGLLLTSCLSCLTTVLDPIAWKTQTLMILI